MKRHVDDTRLMMAALRACRKVEQFQIGYVGLDCKVRRQHPAIDVGIKLSLVHPSPHFVHPLQGQVCRLDA